ncbi:CRISPR-associated helicase Cas3' [Magnetospirillum sp. SS-4]|uniref:CRISPR-associated helicase Cas3' n=1 Tax=Magnetospirillum sp. SS-4 TaxID=2681465 RepID=UPI00137DB791|nr:CRISPR-associated helicase Cas3' [Magnetospirillum sp. SS-4]CAA7616889.1 Predicted CRISPR-associated helicase [Magnetospirillum sp. SS-4]
MSTPPPPIAHRDKTDATHDLAEHLEETAALAHVGNGTIHTLASHLSGTARLSRCFAGRIGLPQAGYLLGLSHDIGKYAPAFQAYLKSAARMLDPDRDEDYVDAASLKGRIDHSTAGAQIIWRSLGGTHEKLAQFLALCCASHHSGLIDCLIGGGSDFGRDGFSRRLDKPEAETHAKQAWTLADTTIRERIGRILADQQLTTQLDAKIRALGSTSASRSIWYNQCGLLARFLFSCLVDADRLNTAHFMRARTAITSRFGSWPILIERLETHILDLDGTSEIGAIRSQVSGLCLDAAARPPGLYTLAVPTGGGKTLASLRFALHHAQEHGLERIFCFLPFTAIIDQNAEVARKALDPKGLGGIVLEHHSNLTPERTGWREKNLTESWEAPVIFTTMVQVLESLFGDGTRGARRMHRLARSVLIFDEVQALPIRFVHMFANAVNFLVDHCGSTVVLCTATQPLLDRVNPNLGAVRRPPGSEIIPDPVELFRDLKRVEIDHPHKDGGWSHAEAADRALAEVRRLGNCLMVVNTKRSARELYHLCRDTADFDVFHLSTNMCPTHRREVLGEVMARLAPRTRRPVLLVSTQLIEAGIDISFASVIRAMAGLDSIAQAAGRCNRNRETALGHVQILSLSEEVLGPNLTDIAKGQAEAERVLREYAADPTDFDDDPIGPKAMERYYEYYFFARRNEMVSRIDKQVIGHDDSLLNLLSSNGKASERYEEKTGKPAPFLKQSFMTAARLFKAIDAPTEGVIVPHGEGKALIAELLACDDMGHQRTLLGKAQAYTVGLFPGELEKMRASGFIKLSQNGIINYCCSEKMYRYDTGLTFMDRSGED